MIQLELPAVPEYEPWLVNCAAIMGLANSGVRQWFDFNHESGYSRRHVFYCLKTEILARHGHQDGFDVQYIKKACWGCGGDGLSAYSDGDECERCGGSGIYTERWILLSRYRLAGRCFHCPSGAIADPGCKPSITGIIEHKASPLSWDAFRVLSDGRYSLQERCTNSSARDLLERAAALELQNDAS